MDTHKPPSDMSTELYWPDTDGGSNTEPESQASTKLYYHSSPPSSQGSSVLPDEISGLWGPIRRYKEVSWDNLDACLGWRMRKGLVFANMK